MSWRIPPYVSARFWELLEFLASAPTQQQIVDYKVSPEIQ